MVKSNNKEDIPDKIINVLKNYKLKKEPINLAKLSKEAKVSFPTLLKYIEILKFKRIIKTSKYFNSIQVELNE